MLTVTPIPYNQSATHGGKNRFECRTCPYQMILDRKYFERKPFELKSGGEDVLGGADSWKNVDRTEGQYCPICPWILAS